MLVVTLLEMMEGKGSDDEVGNGDSICLTVTITFFNLSALLRIIRILLLAKPGVQQILAACLPF